jgi:hypothetical protein|tara:strand:- start:1690 stop:1869 length:180 start_codon:yes stop_codon:yes gene_type:complete
MSEKRREGSDGLAPFSHWAYVLEVISLIYGNNPQEGQEEPTEQEEDSFLPDEIAYTVKK